LSSTSVDKLVTERFEYVRTIKKHIGSIFWKDFGINDFEGTIVLF
ncbi:MAG: hypothetical protein IPF58_10395, partial [Saprospirales bacterium]|nr:hypothetical protein [Saprospirales bacterium]